MNKESLAVKYRPETFDQVVDQNIICKILSKQVEKQNFKNCYLFAGPSGDGKTTLARCFARAINNGEGEPIEIDAASNGSVDNIRAIIESANQRSLSSTYKIFIIDECHAITSTGWQAFLKGIEEPPLYTIFIFCTTEPNKLPQTILNRMQRYNISKISSISIKNNLKYICEQEGFTNYDSTIDLISKVAKGCMRDAITMLDQCASYSTDFTLEDTRAILGNFAFETMLELTSAILNGDAQGLIKIIEDADRAGDIKQFVGLYLDFIIELNKYAIFKAISCTTIPEYLEEKVKYITSFDRADVWYNKFAEYLLTLKTNIKYDLSQKSTVEAYLLKLCRGD